MNCFCQCPVLLQPNMTSAKPFWMANIQHVPHEILQLCYVLHYISETCYLATIKTNETSLVSFNTLLEEHALFYLAFDYLCTDCLVKNSRNSICSDRIESFLKVLTYRYYFKNKVEPHLKKKTILEVFILFDLNEF